MVKYKIMPRKNNEKSGNNGPNVTRSAPPKPIPSALLIIKSVNAVINAIIMPSETNTNEKNFLSF